MQESHDNVLRAVPRILGERCGSSAVSVHPDHIKRQLKDDGAELANHIGRGLTVGVRLVLLGLVWLQLKGAERIGLIEKRWTERRTA